MKYALSGLDLAFLVDEMQGLLGAKIDKIFQPEKDDIIIRMHRTGMGKVHLRFLLPSLVYMAKDKADAQKDPSNFCMFMRKRLSGARIDALEQIGTERMLRIRLQSKDSKYELIAELFGKGNLLLIEAGKVLTALHYSIQSGRLLRPKGEYMLPHMRPDIRTLSAEDIKKKLDASAQPTLVKAIAVDLGMGGVYAEEVILRAGLDKQVKPGGHDLYPVIQDLLHGPLEPAVILEGDKPVSLAPIKMRLYEGMQVKPFGTFSEAIDEVFLPIQQRAKTAAEKKMERLQKIIDAQSEVIKKLEMQIDEEQAKGNAVYADYARLSSLLKQINEARKTKSWDEIAQVVEQLPFVQKLDKKNKVLSVVAE
ncbi:NFACT family protein [Candidatus Woesearchaeota archaeon]|nr:NFACT family protein [Candidatus Woesearchaeota archaeon]